MEALSLFGPVDAILEPIIGYVVLVLLLVNMGTRAFAHQKNVRQADEGDDDAVTRPLVHVVTNVLLLLATFYYMTFEHHAGVVLGTLVLGLFITDYFEFQAFLVQVREGRTPDAPKASIAASVLVLLYIAYQTLFFIVRPFWEQIV